MKLIVGLGNPGPKYDRSRHNVGFECIDAISSHAGIPVTERKPKVVLGRGTMGGEEVVLAKPRTFMNHSGEAVAYLVSRFGSVPGDILIVYDDMDLPLGKVRVRPSGGAGGHRGVASIIDALGSLTFPRIRVGIGRPVDGMEEIGYVLGAFTQEERGIIGEAVVTVTEAVSAVIGDGLDRAMNRFN